MQKINIDDMLRVSISGHLMPDPATQGRKKIVLERLNRIAKETDTVNF